MKERLSASIKTRTTKNVKSAFHALARVRRLNPADLQREAFDQYIEANRQVLDSTKKPAQKAA